MASAMASAAARSVPPPYAIPVGSRIRPPRLLPGTKAANTDPQPDEPPPEKNQVWVQGKWRNINSNAAIDQREVQSRQVEKALRHNTHGMNIYAYSHIRTNQVVYSLSRVMQNNKIMSQLVFHGKKTVPSALRRDVWRPYFSIHFQKTPAGAEAGLMTFHRLRELATWRQLSPPPEMMIATKDDVEKAKRKYNPAHLHEGLKNHTLKDIPIENKMLPKRLRAKKLMDQKATSVADAAYVLELINSESNPAERLDMLNQRREEKRSRLSYRARRRLDIINEKKLVKQGQIEARQNLIQPKEGRLGLTRHAAERIAHDHEGVIVGENVVSQLRDIEASLDKTNEYAMIESEMRALAGEDVAKFNEKSYRDGYIKKWKEQNDGSEGPPSKVVKEAVRQERERIKLQLANSETSQKKTERDEASKIVEVLWADLRDATWAENWSQNVQHGLLEQRAALKRQRMIVRQEATVDADGQEISEQRQRVLTQESSTPHLFGRWEQSGWYELPQKANERRQADRQVKLEAWQQSKIARSKEILGKIDGLQSERAELLLKRDALKQGSKRLARSKTKSQGSGSQEGAVQPSTDAKPASSRDIQTALDENKLKLDEFEEIYPVLFQKVTDLVEWRQGREQYANILRIREELQSIDSLHSTSDSEVVSQLEGIDSILGVHAETYSELSGIEKAESNLVHRTLQHNNNIARLQQKISRLESEEASEQIESTLAELKDELREAKRSIVTIQNATWERRLNAVEQILEGMSEEYAMSTDLLQNRIYAENRDDQEALQNIQMELKEQEEAKMEHLLGLDRQPLKSDVVVTEYDERMREKGLEMPAPSTKKSVWARVRGIFGR